MFQVYHFFTIIKALLNFLTLSTQLKCFDNGKKVVYLRISGLVLMLSIFHALMCIICIKNQQNVLSSTDVFLL